MKTDFYAVGVGIRPLELTLQAKRILEEADLLLIPRKAENAPSAAYALAVQAADIAHKPVHTLIFPMSEGRDNPQNLDTLRQTAALLAQGKTAAMITIGDPVLYSTVQRIEKWFSAQGYTTAYIPGISSFSSGSALAGMPLAQGMENILIQPCPENAQILSEKLCAADTLVLLKAGRHLRWLLPFLEEQALTAQTTMLCRLGMEGEYIGRPRMTSDYFVTLVIRRRTV